MFAVMNFIIIGLVIAGFFDAVEWSTVGIVFGAFAVLSVFSGSILRKLSGNRL